MDEVGGISYLEWFDAFDHCHEAREGGTISRISWPTGGHYTDQDNLVIVMFGLIHQEITLMGNK